MKMFQFLKFLWNAASIVVMVPISVIAALICFAAVSLAVLWLLLVSLLGKFRKR